MTTLRALECLVAVLDFGSVTEAVLHRSPCPVLCVGPGMPLAEGRPFRRILCAVDLEHPLRATLRSALWLASESEAELTLQYVCAPHADLAEVVARVGLRAEMRSCLGPLEPSWLHVEEEISHGEPAAEIARVAAARGVDLVVVGAHARTLLAPTSNTVVRRHPCPVLVVPEGAVALGDSVLQELETW